MARYEQYKNSGIQWLGEIPTHWGILRLKSCCSLKGRIGWNGLKSEEFERSSYAYLVTGQDFRSSVILWDNCYQINQRRYEEDVNIQLANGDLLVTKDGTIGKVAKVSNLDKPACLNSGIFLVRRKNGYYTQGYLYWCLLSSVLIEYNRYIQTGATIAHLYQNVFEQMPCLIPPFEEQKAIADYLDTEVSKIDEAIKQQQQMIELLNERRQIIISEAVTKGLNPDVQMKDSGIDWVGVMPEHWEIRKFKRVAKVQANLVSPKCYPDFPQVAPENIEKGTGKLLEYTTVAESGVISDNHLFQAGQIIYSKIRPTLNKLIVAPFDGLCSADMYPVTTSMNVRFLHYYMLSKPFVTQVNKVVMDRVKMPKINKEELSLIYVLVPPVKEQKDIINYLNKRLEIIDNTIEKHKNITDRLTERKRIIINDVVTGKVKVS